MRGVDDSLTYGLIRWQEGQILEKMNAECPGIALQVLGFRTVEQLMVSEVLREGTRFEEFRLRLEGLTSRIGG